MSVASALAQGRLAAEARMVERCTFTRASGERVYDQAAMAEVDAPPTLVWSGPCRLSNAAGLEAREMSVGQAEVAVARWRLDVPIAGTEAIRPRDLVEITDSVTPGLAGQRLVVANLFASTATTARRLPVEAVA